MKYFYLLSVFLLSIISCDAPKHPDATSLCQCWSMLRFEKIDSISNKMADSCDNLYKNIIVKGEGYEEWNALFKAAYNECR